ncbi:uncharacterized protein LOC123316015 [Coccinella septempunctata]|uniref:uncharacterized protein LOC123316015 n=1 Tax=Coccinella septempunctata TaxID=41139 RepID=UPI001D07AFC9|nr:uncharacterized protein LOC123316015 [Coccinella septempunctata]
MGESNNYSFLSENNKSASLPKPSSHHTTNQSYCASNEDFTASDLKVKRDLVLQRTLEKNVIRNNFTNNVIKRDVPELTQGRRGDLPTESELNERVQTNCNRLNETQSTEESEESLYANADETRSIFSAAHKRELSHMYKSLPPERIIRTPGEFTSGKGENVDKNNTFPDEDCIKFGIPAKRLENIRRSLGRSTSQEMVKQTKYDKVEEISRTADSEDEAVYANTTERYSTFRTTPKSELGVERSKEKCSSPKFVNVEVARSPVLPEKKLSPYFVSKNNVGSNIPQISSTKTEISSNAQPKQDFAAIIEECIQLGMPKRKEFSRETLNSNLSLSSTNSRCNSVTRCTEYLPKSTLESNRSATLPKGSTHFSTSYNHYSSNEDFSRAISQRKNSCGTFGQDKNQLNITKKEPDRMSNSQISSRSSSQKDSSPYNIRTVQLPQVNTNMTDKSDISYGEEEPEESLYVNVSKHEAYSRCTNRRNTTQEPKNLPTKNTSTYNTRDPNIKEPNYSALVEECIKLGMPSKNIGEVQKYLKKFVPLVQDQNERPDVFDSPDDTEEQIYANTSDIFTAVKGSPSESVLNRIPRAKGPYNSKKNIDELEKEKVIASSNTIEKALEECIQLGWPKKRDLGKDPSPKFSITTSADASIKKTEKSVSKNVNVASVVRNMQRQHLACSKVPSMTTGARDDSEHQNVSTTDVEETLTSDKLKNGFDATNSESECSSTSANEFLCSDDNQAESEMSFSSLADVDVKLLDPHLVLQSLEQYTAQLISEAELRLNSKES